MKRDPKRSYQQRPRPKLIKVSDEMRRWSVLLGEELKSWPGVTSRPMFGFDAFYRRGTIFAVLPRTRALETSHSVAFKLPSLNPGEEAELRSMNMIGERWRMLELRSESDLSRTFKWFDRAYRAAK